MAPTGRSGANDADIAGMNRMDTADDVTGTETDELGEPIGLVEVFEVEELEPAVASPEAYPENQSWFRWWYVPAVVAPLAGATAAFILLRRRRREPVPVVAYKAAVKQSRDWLATVRDSKAAQSAANALQQGATTVRASAKNLPENALALRDRTGELVGVVVTSTAAQQAVQGVRGALDTATDFLSTNAPKAKQAAQAQGQSAYRWFVSGQARKVMQAQAATASKALERAKPVVKSARMTASKNASKAAAKTNRVANRAGKRANRAIKRTRAFAFGALVTATITYARAWRKRLMEHDMRETAAGRLVRD